MKKLFEFLIQKKQNRENLCQSNLKKYIQFFRNKKIISLILPFPS